MTDQAEKAPQFIVVRETKKQALPNNHVQIIAGSARPIR